MTSIAPAEARARVSAGDRLCAAGPEPASVDEHTASAAGHAVNVRVYEPPEARAVLVYAHGGGWVTGDLDYADELCRFLAVDAECTVVSVDYRLAPEHPFPAALDDVATAVAWSRARWPDLPLGIGGDSSGGNLAAATVVDLRPTAAVAFQVLVYPVLDHDLTRRSYVERANAFPVGRADMEWFFDHYVAAAYRDDPRVSPLRSPDLTGLPPTHVAVAGHDPLHDEGRAYAEALARAGVCVSLVDERALCHGFLRFTGASSAAARARDDIVRRVSALAAAIHAYDSPPSDPAGEGP